MGTIKGKTGFRCYEDCKMEGCPAHELEIRIQTTSDIMTVSIDGKEWFMSDPGQWKALMRLLKETDYTFFDIK